MIRLNKIKVLGKFLFLSLLKLKATQLFAVLSVAILVLSWSVSDINIASKYKLFEDILLTSQMFMLHTAALFYTFEYLQKERFGGIMIVPFSTGIHRSEYIFSIMAALATLLFFLGTIFLLIDTMFLWVIEVDVNYMVLWQLFLYLISAILLSAFILLFSQFVSTMNAVIYALTIFIIGNALDEVYYYSLYMQDQDSVKNMALFLFYAFPNFSIFDLQAIVVNRVEFDLFEVFARPIIHSSILYVMVSSLMLWKFNTRVLRVGE